VDRAGLPAAALYPSRVFFSLIEINRGYNSHARRRQPPEMRRSSRILLLGSLRRIYGTLARNTRSKGGGRCTRKEKKKGERRGRRLLIISASKGTWSLSRYRRFAIVLPLRCDPRNLRPLALPSSSVPASWFSNCRYFVSFSFPLATSDDVLATPILISVALPCR